MENLKENFEAFKMFLNLMGDTPAPAKAAVEQKNPLIGKFVVIRSNMSGTVVGTLEHLEGNVAIVSNSKKCWEWHIHPGGVDCHEELALNGFAEKSKISVACPLQYVYDCIQVLEASEVCRKTVGL